MPHHRRHQADEEAPSPRPSAAGCYAFLTRSHRAAPGGGYRRLHSAPASARALDAAAAAVRVRVRVEVGTTRERAKSVFHVDPVVLEAGPVRRLLAAAGRRAPGGGGGQHNLLEPATTPDGDGAPPVPDPAEITGRFRAGLARLLGRQAVVDLAKFASSLLPPEGDEEPAAFTWDVALPRCGPSSASTSSSSPNDFDLTDMRSKITRWPWKAWCRGWLI